MLIDILSDLHLDFFSPYIKENGIWIIGDLVDRGKDSAKVIKLLLDNNWQCVLGNYESMMLKSLNNDNDNFLWQQCGGRETLKLYDHLDDKVWDAHIVISHSYLHRYICND